MKKFFKTKFKKIISIFTAIVILTLVLIIPVSASGQNLFNGTWEQGRLESSGGVSSVINWNITSSFINLSKGSYILSVSDSFQIAYNLYNSNGVVISSNLSYSSNSIEFSTSVDCRIRICVRRTNLTNLTPSEAPNVSLIKNLYSVNYLDNISLVNLYYDELFESSRIYDHDSLSNIWYSSDLVSETFHFKDGRMILDFSSSYNGIVETGIYHCSFPFIFKPNGSADITGSLNTVNYTITFSDSVSHSGTCTFTNVDYIGGSLYSLIEFDLNISQPSNNLFNNFKLQFDFYNASSDASSMIYWYGFMNSPSIIYNNPYPSFDSSSIDDTMQEEADILDRFTNDFNGVMDSLENSLWGFLGGNQQSIFAFRRIADNFFDKPWFADIISVSIICGILPFLGRIFIRRNRD